MKVSAVIVAAGKGTRMGADKNKVFLELMGKTVLEHTIDVFEKSPIIDEIIVVTNDIKECETVLSGYTKVSHIVLGGATRQESVNNGLVVAKGDYVAIHDGARALICEKEINAAISEGAGASLSGIKSPSLLSSSSPTGVSKETGS